MTETYIVYVKTDDAGRITAVNSSAFLEDASEWLEIDRGSDLRHYHAQGNYFPKPIRDERGICRYKMQDGKPVERTAEEMDADYADLPAPEPTVSDRLTALEQAGLERDAALIELAMMLTGGE